MNLESKSESDGFSKVTFISSSSQCLGSPLSEVVVMENKNYKIRHLTNCPGLSEGYAVITVKNSDAKAPSSKKDDASKHMYLKRI